MNSFIFPLYSESYLNAPKSKRFKRLHKQLGYMLFYFFNRKKINNLSTKINSHKETGRVLSGNIKIGTICSKKYMSNKTSTTERFSIIEKEIDFAVSHLPTVFFTEHKLMLSQVDDDTQVTLQLNPSNWMEGIWSIVLCHQGINVYILTFSVASEGTLLIGSLQGTNHDDSKNLIKKLTKNMEGLRPQQLMIYLAIRLANAFKIPNVEGLSMANHPKMTFKKRILNKDLFIADYENIWPSYGGELLANGNWLIPEMKLKNIGEVASKKRAMYRRRYIMLDEIKASINSAIHQ